MSHEQNNIKLAQTTVNKCNELIDYYRSKNDDSDEICITSMISALMQIKDINNRYLKDREIKEKGGSYDNNI